MLLYRMVYIKFKSNQYKSVKSLTEVNMVESAARYEVEIRNFVRM